MEEMELTTVNNEVNVENPEIEEVEESGSCLPGVALLVGAGVGLTLLTQKVIIPGAKKAIGAVRKAVADAKANQEETADAQVEDQPTESK